MKKITKHTIRIESIEDMLRNGKFGPCLEISFKDKFGKHTNKLKAGLDDDIYVYQDEDTTYVLSLNKRLGYIGMEAFSGDNRIEDIFLDESEAIELLKRKNLAAVAIVKRLKEYI